MERAGVHGFGFMISKPIASSSDGSAGKVLTAATSTSVPATNPTTALVYTDLGLFTADKVMADDVSTLFTLLTGYS
jgi:polyphosphate kinase